jgi:hypothetical protein
MTNRAIGIILISSIVMSFFVAIFEPAMSTDLANGFYTIAGLGIFIFGTLAGVKLIKLK